MRPRLSRTERANGKLSHDDITGTFTITNVGLVGGLFTSSPITEAVIGHAQHQNGPGRDGQIVIRVSVVWPIIASSTAH